MKSWVLYFLMAAMMVLFTPKLVLAAEKESLKNTPIKLLNIIEIPQAIAETELIKNNIPSPHWKNNACDVCHLDAKKATQYNLRIKKINDVCDTCHDARFDHSYIHPIGVKPSKKMLSTMNKDYKKILRKTFGKIGCVSCHDIALQCQAEKSSQRLTNPKFFRLGPFKSRSQPCYFCHDKNSYQRLNPHDQLDNKGNIREQKCRICHSGSAKKLSNATSINEVTFNAADDNLSSMCWGCHVWSPHPGGQFSFFKNKTGPNHLIKPPDYILKAIKKTEKEQNIVLPLEPKTGKIFCGTCHNPHEKGVIKNLQAASGADANRRLRTENICHSCHDK